MKVCVLFDQVFYYPTPGELVVGVRGEVVELPDDQGDRLIGLGAAERVKGKPGPKPHTDPV